MLTCDTKCIHGGKPIEAGARYAMTLYTLLTEDGPRKIFRASGIDRMPRGILIVNRGQVLRALSGQFLSAVE